MKLSKAIKLSPAIWLAGATPFAYHLIALLGQSPSDRPKWKLSPHLILLTLFVSTYALSIASAAISGADTGRVIAALYNLSFWIVGCLVISRGRLEETNCSDSAYLILAILVLLGFIAYVAPISQSSLRLPSLLGLFLNEASLPDNLRANIFLNIFSEDWSSLGNSGRISIMAPYPTAYGMLVLSLLTLSIPDRSSGRFLPRFLTASALALFGSFLCASRAVTGAVLVYCALFLILSFTTKLRGWPAKFAIVFLLLTASVILLVIFYPLLVDLWSIVNSARSGSSVQRFNLYRFSVESALRESPMIGFGVKDRINEFTIPLGSHSTFVGAFYKSGIIGFSWIIGFFALCTLSAVRAGSRNTSSPFVRSASAGVVAMILVLFFEDLDAVPLVAFLFFATVKIVTTDRTPT